MLWRRPKNLYAGWQKLSDALVPGRCPGRVPREGREILRSRRTVQRVAPAPGWALPQNDRCSPGIGYEDTMRVLIVDDEPAARRRLALMLEELDEEVVGEAANGMEALQMVA